MSAVTLTIEETGQLIADALVASKTSVENARSVADALVGAELDGQAGHGLRRVPAYAAQARSGKANGFAVPRAERTRPGAVHIDGDDGFAFPAMDLAHRHLTEMTPEQGIAIAGIHRSHHAGVAGLAVEALANEGLVALMFANSPAAMAPWGGNRALFGTDPIAFAAPLGDDLPVVVDVSLSKVARGKIMAAAQKGEPIPEGWALDKDGNPTTEAKAGLEGTMIPLGDAKGTALALMVELLCAGLTGANYGYQATTFFDDKGPPPGTGQTIIAIDPAAFGGASVVARFAEMAQSIMTTEGARIPGRRRQELRERHMRDGISADSALIDQIRAIGAA